MWQGSWTHLWTLTSSFCCMSRLASWFLLRKITKHTSLLYLCIFQKSILKTQKNICGIWSILCKLWDYIPQLTSCEIQQRSFTRNLILVLFTALKYKKALTMILKENLDFKQLQFKYIKSKKKQTEKECLRLVIALLGQV